MNNSFILYIEDDEDDRLAFERCVSSILPDVACLFAHTGSEAVGVLRDTFINPYCIFIELDIPTLNGLQVLERIRQIVAYKQIPCYILTGRLNDDIYSKAIALGATDVFEKPVGLSELKKLLSKVLSKP